MAYNKMGGVKARPNSGKDLKGEWHVTIKVDGVRMLRRQDGTPVSRADKPLYNLDYVQILDIKDAEIYAGNWEDSISLVRTMNAKPVPIECVYSLDPLDERLNLGVFTDPTHKMLQALMEAQVKLGYEGLIVRQGNTWLKYKPSDSADVRVTGMKPGTGKHVGKMGALLTKYGDVGTGFTDKQREEFQALHDAGQLKGLLIEVSFMQWTKGGKMRHPVFERIREDKTEESLGGNYDF